MSLMALSMVLFLYFISISQVLSNVSQAESERQAFTGEETPFIQSATHSCDLSRNSIARQVARRKIARCNRQPFCVTGDHYQLSACIMQFKINR